MAGGGSARCVQQGSGGGNGLRQAPADTVSRGRVHVRDARAGRPRERGDRVAMGTHRGRVARIVQHEPAVRGAAPSGRRRERVEQP
jgi:hypothetical protein